MDRKKRTRTPFTPIGQVLTSVLEQCRSANNGGIMHLITVWDRVIAPPIVDNARPFAVNGTLLLLHVSSSVWLHQLRFLKADLLDALNRELTDGPLTDIKFKIGPLT